PRDSSAQEPSQYHISRLIMFFALLCPAPRDRAFKSTLLKRAAAVGSLAAIAGLVACGGGRNSANQSPPPGTDAAGTLSLKASLPAGTEGTTYDGSLSASGGTSPYSYAVVWGQMP